MKKFLSALLAAVLLLSATACAAHEPVLPPSRWGEGEAQGMLPHTYSLSEAYDAAEVVALVTVGDWLEEELITGRTFFRTTVQKVYKGDIPHEFVLAQEGCSTWTYRNYPVFTYGNQLLLFLIKYDVSMYRDTYDLVEYPDAYELINTYSTVMYVTQDDSGMSYVLDALGMVAEGVPNTLSVYEIARKLGVRTPLIDAVYSVLYESKPPMEALVELMTRDPRPELD